MTLTRLIVLYTYKVKATRVLGVVQNNTYIIALGEATSLSIVLSSLMCMQIHRY